MNTVEEYVDFQEPSFRELLFSAHRLVTDLVPGADCRIRYAIPFYYFHGPFVYLNVPKKSPCVELAFVKGKYMQELPGLPWRPVERKQVRSVELRKPSDFGHLRVLLQEAVLLNEARPGWSLNKSKKKT